ncbi:10581_t:CDS:2 [Gigaspora margarita]|uniref:10581_t:CDS:1 n=1 Tax=Gigaspora margarita TaxID=4874 RepID=A0ABN7W7D0_GIGMA|nr:10581_t:CDS:2 [Gigaspora margarita]
MVLIRHRLGIKGNQKYEKKGTKEIFDELLQMAKEGILNHEEIPSKQTIQSWIGRYSAANKKK